MVKKIQLVHLYPKEMNIYGDTGNVLVLARRMQWRGIDFDFHQVGVGEQIPNGADIIISGGGQDKGQMSVEKDLAAKKHDLKGMADNGVSMLLICGTYQLFGHRFVTGKNESIAGIGVLDVETFAGQERMIGNIAVESDFGVLVGYENHSGLTYLGEGAKPFGIVRSGAGNNLEDNTEGATYNNVYGTYLHGPILPKNPTFADELIRQALVRNGGEGELPPLEDSLENAAKDTALSRPR